MFGKKKNIQTKPPLKVIVVGAGKVGTAIVDVLTSEGNDITLIDQDPERVEEFTGTYDIMGLVGNGASFQVQKEAGIDEADLLIAVTESDELNLLCATIAQQGRKCTTIARVRTPEYSAEKHYLQQHLNLAMILNPELSAAAEIARILRIPKALDVTSFAHGLARMIRVRLEAGSPIIGMTVAEYTQTYPEEQMIFCAIERDDNVKIAYGDFMFRENDIVAFVCQYRYISSTLDHMGISGGGVKNCLIIGGGSVSFYLATSLLADRINVKIIEKDKDRADFLSENLPDAVIINGDGTDDMLLHEESLEKYEAFVPLTGIDEENIILSLHAKQNGATKVVTKLDRLSFNNVVRSLDLGSVVFPRYLTAESIIAYARAKRASLESNKIETLTYMYDRRVECLEFSIDESSRVTGTPIKDLPLKKDLTLTYINRRGRVLFPLGNDTIEVGDTVMVVTTHTGFADILDILE